MTDEARNAGGPADRALLPEGRPPAMPLDADQPSDIGFEDYDLDPWDDSWRLLQDVAAHAPAAFKADELH